MELRKGWLRRGELVLVADRPVSSRQTTTLVQARGWINASGVGWIMVWQAELRLVALRWGLSRRGTARNHHAVGAVPASTPDGGISLVTARRGKARRVELVHGTANAALVIGTRPLRRGGAESWRTLWSA